MGSFSVLFNAQLKPIKSIQNIRDKDNDGNSLLHIACLNKQLHLIEAFLSISNLFDVNLQNEEGNTPLHLIIVKDSSYIAIIECLITHYDASPYIRNKLGETPQFLLSFSQFGLQRIPELNILLSMHTFRQKNENVSIPNNNESSLRTAIKAKISNMSPQNLLVYRQIYREMTNGSLWLRKDHLCAMFERLNLSLCEPQIKQILNTIDLNNDGHCDFDDFLAFLLTPMDDWTTNVLSKKNSQKRENTAEQFE
eukprot:830581_1